MKILLLSDAKSPHTQRWIEYYLRQNFEIFLISTDEPPLEFQQNGNFLQLKKFILEPSIISFPLNIFFNQLQIKKIIRQYKPDILHAHFLTTNGFFGSLTFFHPLIVSVWGSDVLSAPHKSKIALLIVKFVLKRSKIITVTNKSMIQYLNNQFGCPVEKIRFIPWGINLEIFHRGYKDEVSRLKEQLKIEPTAPIVLSPRTLNEIYQVKQFIYSIPDILKKHPTTVFILLRGYGTQKYQTEISEVIKELKISDNIRLIESKLSSEEMAQYFNMADVFISIPKTDQFGSTVMEGMATGCIPVVSNIEPYKQYLKDKFNAFFVDSDNPSEIAKAIILCLGTRSIKEEFAEINKQIIMKYENFETNGKKMIDLYYEVESSKT